MVHWCTWKPLNRNRYVHKCPVTPLVFLHGEEKNRSLVSEKVIFLSVKRTNSTYRLLTLQKKKKKKNQRSPHLWKFYLLFLLLLCGLVGPPSCISVASKVAGKSYCLCKVREQLNWAVKGVLRVLRDSKELLVCSKGKTNTILSHVEGILCKRNCFF